jgi:hypothetical protein
MSLACGIPPVAGLGSGSMLGFAQVLPARDAPRRRNRQRGVTKLHVEAPEARSAFGAFCCYWTCGCWFFGGGGRSARFAEGGTFPGCLVAAGWRRAGGLGLAELC